MEISEVSTRLYSLRQHFISSDNTPLSIII
jgi:hypothetical protein